MSGVHSVIVGLDREALDHALAHAGLSHLCGMHVAGCHMEGRELVLKLLPHDPESVDDPRTATETRAGTFDTVRCCTAPQGGYCREGVNPGFCKFCGNGMP